MVGDRPYLQVVPDSTPGGGGGFAVRALFPAGWVGGWSPVWIERDISEAEYTRLFISFRLKLSDNWQGHPVGDKILYAWTHGKPVLYPLYVGGGYGPLSSEIRVQDTPDGARNLPPNLGDVPIRRGAWHRWEVLLVSNTPGLSDGEIHWWIDGRKLGEYADIRFAGPEQESIWEMIAWRPIWGGSGSVIREDQYMWIDELYASGAL